ncbi:UvrD-helicase domain-containing protein [Patescibacteria group bacterium]|nr:UvrD-helicase domain-containing protein [Patescibacteria group bacterium]
MAEKIVLNKQQKEAVEHDQGPLLIIAGAGTGKTTVITERIKRLIISERANPSEILALTFTEKAAKEMEERVDMAMPYGYTQMWISTFHSFCDRILRREALHIGIDPKFKLMTEAETIQFIRSNLFKFKLSYFRPLGNPTKFVAGLLQHFSRLQDEDISPNEYLKYARSLAVKKRGLKEEKMEAEKTAELARTYQTYQELKVKEGVMDFGDLIGKTLELFRKRPNVLREYRKQFKYMLVDEFQDTNIAQYELLKLLVPPGKKANLAVVGDDSQSIYKFRGAAVSNILYFMDDYKEAKMVVLTKNYRSTQKILDSAYRLITHNNPDTLEAKLGVDKNLISVRNRNTGEQVEFIHRDRVENEAEEVAKRIEELVGKGDYEWKDIAVLVRANSHSEPFIRAFSRHAIPYQFLGPGRLFRQPEIIDLISYLKVLYNFEDSIALYRLLSIDHFDIPAKDLLRIGNYAKRFNLALFEACEKVDDIVVSDQTKEKMKKILKIIDRHLKRVRKETAGQLLYYFLEDTGLLQELLNPDTPGAEKKAANISKLFDKLKTYEVNHEDATVTAVVDWIELSSELGESPLAADIDWTESNAVNILTAHSAKGLEFPVVFLVNLVSQRFPTIERREQIPIPEELIKEVLPIGDYHEQEERRLFYVGMTRAKDRLFFTAANYYGEGKREKKLSPFIFEALGDDTVAAEQPESGQQLSFLDYASAPQSSVISHQSSKLHIDYLSYTQIETFKTCPLHYKLRYIVKIPTPPTSAQSFGASIHAALKDFYLYVKGGEKPRKELILKALKENWIAEGYASKSHERKMLERGRKYLAGFFKKEFDPKKAPIALEQPFVVPLDSLQGDPRRLKIGGKIDRIDELLGGKIEIIDYKTGAKVPTQKQVDHDLQLTFYALAATGMKEAPLNKKPGDVKLTLYYFDNQTKISTSRTQENLEEAKKEIFDWREKIENSDFSCSKHFFCKNCEYSLMCRSDSS